MKMLPVASVGMRAQILGAPSATDGSASDVYAAAAKDEAARIRELQKTDTEVRAHERAHQSAGGALTGSAKFTYERGPDGQMYAVAGEVPVSLGPGRTPEETLQRARMARAAANAPANPSSADRMVAAMAAALEAEAMREIVAQVRGGEASPSSSSSSSSSSSDVGDDSPSIDPGSGLVVVSGDARSGRGRSLAVETYTRRSMSVARLAASVARVA